MDAMSDRLCRWVSAALIVVFVGFEAWMISTWPLSKTSVLLFTLQCACGLFIAAQLITLMAILRDATGLQAIWMMRMTLWMFGAGIIILAGTMSFSSMSHGYVLLALLHGFNAVLGVGVFLVGCVFHRIL